MATSTLQKEIGKKRPFESPEQEATLNLERTHDWLSRAFAQIFKERGLSAPQYNVLRILRGHGGDGVPCQRIAGDMLTFDPDVTRLVDRLERAGMVERRRTKEDRRVVLVKITPKGLAILKEMDGPVRELHRKQLGHMTRAELAELNRLLAKARRSE